MDQIYEESRATVDEKIRLVEARYLKKDPYKYAQSHFEIDTLLLQKEEADEKRIRQDLIE